MAKFNVMDLPMGDLQALNLVKDGDLLLDQQSKNSLLSGAVTPLVRLNDLQIQGTGLTSLDAKLSLAEKPDGTVGLYVHPIYNQVREHPDLSKEEMDHLLKSGSTLTKNSRAHGEIVNFGNAKYDFNDKNQPSYFIQVSQENGNLKTIWGKELEEALNKSGTGKGDNVQIDYYGSKPVTITTPIHDEQGKEIGREEKNVHRNTWEIKDFVQNQKPDQTLIYQFDKETNSFVSIDTKNIPRVDAVNGIPLSEKAQKKLKNGETVEIEDGSLLKVTPSSPTFLSSNTFVVTSMLLDGGISYALIKGAEMLVKLGQSKLAEQNQHKKAEFDKGYTEALAKVQKDLEQKSAKYPNDKGIINDLNIVKNEIAKTSEVKIGDQKQPSVNSFKEKVNDPEQGINANRELKEKEHHEDAKLANHKQGDTMENEERRTSRAR